jgi:type IV pilus assembly protein PilE
MHTHAFMPPKTVAAQKRGQGFTLIELMVVVAVIAILAGIAYPSYTRYIVDARRTQAQGILLQVASLQEKFLTQCGYYGAAFAGAPPATLTCGGGPGAGNIPMLAAHPDIQNDYMLAIAPGPSGDFRRDYQITATPIGTQASRDTDCGSLTLDSRGTKGQTGPNTAGRCWRK